MRCPACGIGKLKPAPGYFGGPMTYGCAYPGTGHPFGTPDTGCGWTGTKPPGIVRRLVGKMMRHRPA